MSLTPRPGRGHRIAGWLLSVLYMAAGVAHLVAPAGFLLIMPKIVPDPALVITVTGWCEIAGAIALHIAPLRRLAAVSFALYAVCVFPANIHHALYGLPPGYVRLGLWYHVPRLLMQPVLVWAAIYAGGPWSGPRRRSRRRRFRALP